MATGRGLLATSHLVVPQVPRLCSSCTPLTTLVPVSRTTRSRRRVEEPVNSTVLSMSTRRRWRPTVSRVSTVASSRRLSVSSSTVVFTSVSTIHSVRDIKHMQVYNSTNDYNRACCPCWRSPGLLPGFLLAWLECHHWCWSRFLSSRHNPVRPSPVLQRLAKAAALIHCNQSSHDDDLRLWCKLQVDVRRWLSNHCQGGCQVTIQGCWCEHSSWCCWRWCVGALRQDPGDPIRQGLLWRYVPCLIIIQAL